MSISSSLSTASVARVTAATSTSTTRTDPDAAFESLGKALESGDLGAAKEAMASFKAAGSRGGPGGGPHGPGGPGGPGGSGGAKRAGSGGGQLSIQDSDDDDESSTKFDPKAAFETLSKALESGDVDAAKEVYATLKANKPSAPTASALTQTSSFDPFAESSGSTVSYLA